VHAFGRYLELQRLYKSRIEELGSELAKESARLDALKEQRKFVIEQLAKEVRTEGTSPPDEGGSIWQLTCPHPASSLDPSASLT
jgi:hypothetical protein